MQLDEQAAPGGSSTGRLVTLNETAGQLDWSKLVKVTFKSARDNQTIYTVIMNSSELSHHPISDWSSELPGLLKRDFDKLSQKWLHVFPDLMRDLAGLITNRHPINGSQFKAHEVRIHTLESGNQTSSLPTAAPVPSATTLVAPNASHTSLTPHVTSALPTTTSAPSPTPGGQVSRTSQSNATNTATSAAVTRAETPTTTSSTTIASLAPVGGSSMGSSANQTISPTTASTQERASSQAPQRVGLGGASTSTAEPGVAQNVTVDLAAPHRDTSSHLSQQPTTVMGDQAEPERHLNAGLERPSRRPGWPGGRNKTVSEIIQDIQDENLKIEDNVKEQGSSLKHFIIICSISTVIATSLVVALIMLLMK